MRRIQAIIAFCSLVFIPVAGVPGQDVLDTIRGSRIAVLPFVNATGVSEYDAVAESVSEALRLIVHWSEQYQVRQMTPFDPFQPEGRAGMSRTARDMRVRVVVFGRIVEMPGGRIGLESAVYGSEEGRILGSAATEAFGAFDLVEAADELVLTTASALLGYPVELGAIVFNPSRTDVTYRVIVDGVDAGENVRILPQVLVGRRLVEVMLDTSQGEVPVHSSEHLIRPGEAVDILFSLPAVTRREQEDIVLRHGLAARLLGDPSQYPWAREALQESEELLARSRSTALDPYRREQAVLTAAWELDREFHSLRVSAFSRAGQVYLPGDPLPLMSEARRLGREDVSRDARVARRILRNGYTQYYLTWLRWGESLSLGLWEEAAQILDDLAELDRAYSLGVGSQLAGVRRDYEAALEEAESIARRRRRPWPYITLGIGLGGVGVGAYMYATDEVDNYDGSDRDVAEIVQWSALGAGTVISIASIVRIVRNNRAGDNYLREWVRDTYGYLMDTSDRVFEYDDGDRAPGEARVLVLGPMDETITAGSRLEQLPAFLSAPAGRVFATGRATVVPGEAGRLLEPGLTIVTVE